ncbi:MAG: glycosyltransferase [Fidelibacterota bacterium]|nr:MAG: glycosyltransferase [Candidatus Neomarinimicrobiota bacterium]
MYVLTFNSHQPYVYELARISGLDLLVIDELPGRHQDKWDSAVRALPSNIQLLSLDAVLQAPPACDVLIAHNLTDLSAVQTIDLPKVLLIHSSLEGLLATQTTTSSRDDIHRILQTYIQLKQVMVTGVSTMKAASWGITDCPIIPFTTDTDFFQGYTGTIPKGLRVTTQLISKREVLNLDFFTNLINGFDVQLVGRNRGLDSVIPETPQDLLQLYQSHRFYIHTAAERMEDGYNMASLEAMATGMPIICNQHTSAPIVNGKSGFMSSNVTELQEKMRLLESNLDLARTLGEEARQYVVANHSFDQFEKKWVDVLELAIRRYEKDRT